MIPSYAFFCCKSLKKLVLPARADARGYESICNCDSLTEVRLPEGISCIDYAAVGGNRRLKELVVPENVDYIDDEAFLGCTGLKRVILKTKHIKSDSFLPDELRGKVEVVYSTKNVSF